ncbi:MAG: hypothetical protein GY790_16075 [Bacteroidetes bacterium]|nr:hypothetical protein [Bacteroidota bacterium]
MTKTSEESRGVLAAPAISTPIAIRLMPSSLARETTSTPGTGFFFYRTLLCNSASKPPIP